MNDISSRADIEFLVTSFYKALLSDPGMEHFFSPMVASGQLDMHLQTITDFWHDILFLSSSYGKNAMKPHIELSKRHTMTDTHFSSWLGHFNTTVDQYFSGEKAQLAKSRAQSIATVMQIKLRDL